MMTRSVSIVAALLASACIYGPHDDQRVANRDVVLTWEGMSPVAHQRVGLSARNASGGFEEFAFAISEDVATDTGVGSYYSWRTTAAIPRRFWTAGVRGYKARIRNDRGLKTLAPDWWQCLQEHDELLDFNQHCTSPKSPEMDIVTADYCDRATPAPTLDRLEPFGQTSPVFPGAPLDFRLRGWTPDHVIDHVDLYVNGEYDGKAYCLPTSPVSGEPGVTGTSCTVVYADHPKVFSCEGHSGGFAELPEVSVVLRGRIGAYCDWQLASPVTWEIEVLCP